MTDRVVSDEKLHNLIASIRQEAEKMQVLKEALTRAQSLYESLDRQIDERLDELVENDAGRSSSCVL